MQIRGWVRCPSLGPRLIWWGLLSFVASGPCFAQTTGDLTARYFEQLRQRRLFSVAEQLGLDRLADPVLSADEAIRISIELSKTYAEHARFTSGEEHDAYWERSQSVVDHALESQAAHPRRLALKVQKASLPTERGEFLRGQVELFPYDRALRKQAQSVLEQALESLRPIESELAREHRQLTARRQRGPGDLATYEIHDWLSDVRFRLGRANQALAEVVDPFSPARNAALREAFRWFELLSEGPPDDPLTPRAKFFLAKNYRLRNDPTRAAAVLDELEDAPPPPELLADVVAERVRWLVSSGELPDAAQRLQAFRQQTPQVPGELAVLNVEVLLALWEVADKKQDADTANGFKTSIASQVKKIQAEQGGYWGFRANRLWEQLEQSQRYGPEVAAILRRAEARYAAGEWDRSLEDYQQASTTAASAGKPGIAFDLGYTRASILVQAERFDEAAASFQQLVETFPQNPRAASAHLLKAYCLGKLYEETATQAHREAYTNALTLHVKNYAGHETAGDAHWMQGLFEEQRRQITLALKAYREVPTDHRRGPAAHVALARCYEKILERLEELGTNVDPKQQPALEQKTAEWEAAATGELGQLVAAYPSEPNPLNHEEAEVVLRLARLQLHRTQPHYQPADSLLERLLVSGAQRQSQDPPLSEAAKTEWTRIINTARQLRIVSLAGQGLASRAQTLVKELSDSSTNDVLAILDGLMLVARAVDDDTQRELGRLQLQTALELNRRREELDLAEQERLDHCLAQAYLATNQTKDALTIYDKLIAKEPKNRALLKRVATLLTECEQRDCLLKAKRHWQTLEAQEKPGSTPWLEMRYQIARCCLQLGQREECRKLLGVTRLLYPLLGGEELKAKYDQLQRELEQNS